MSWFTFFWAMLIGACVTMALPHLLLGLWERRAYHLAFVLTAAAVIALAFIELSMTRVGSIAEFARLQRWMEVPLFVIAVALVAFVRLYLHSGRLWLGLTACALRLIALVISFAFSASLGFRGVAELRHVTFLGETVSTPIGMTSPSTPFGELSYLILALFVIDASFALWRTNNTDNRRRALAVGGSISLFLLLVAALSALIHWQILAAPYLISFAFAAILLAMTFELGFDLFHAKSVAQKLRDSEVSLRDVEERVNLAAEAANLGVWELNPLTNEFWTSDKWRALFQFDEETRLTYADFQDRIHPDDRPTRELSLQDTIASNSGHEAEFRVLLPDGTVRWMAGRARCYYDSAGAPCRLLGVTMDVTQRRQAEELFRVATESSPCGILLLDAQGQIILANPQVEKLFGYQNKELVDNTIGVLLPGRYAEPYAFSPVTSFSGTAQNGVGQELIARRKDGTELPVEIALNVIQTSQRFLVLVTIVNLAARKAAEEEARERRQQVDLLSRASLLGEMTASIAHELNQPLSAIVNNATAGIQYIEKGRIDGDELREIFTDVIADGRRANAVISSVRTAIKKGSAIRGPLNLNDVVRAVTHIVYPDAAAHLCKLQTSLAKDLPAIEGDPTQMQQVLINLIRNAFDAMRDTPPAQRVVHISTKHNGSKEAFVAVRDYGAGLPATTKKDQLFEQFFTTKEDGLGMGLAIVRSIVEAHGGKIVAENAEGGGALFYFHLPTADSQKR